MNLKRITLDDTVEETVNKINENSTDIEENVSRLETDFISYKDNITLKTSKIEKELNDYKATMQQVNINQEPKQKATGYGVISLPPNAAEGQFSDIGMKARTYTNLLGDKGDFETSDGWSLSNATISNAQKLYGSNSLLLSATDSTVSGAIDIDVDEDKYYLVYGHCYINEYTSGLVRITIYDKGTYNNASSVIADTTKINQWQKIGRKFTGRNGVRVQPNIVNATAKVYFDGLMLTEITEDEYNNLTVDELLERYPYVNGTKSTISAFRIRSVSEDESQESVVYVLAKDDEGNIEELRSLPNGVKDEINVTEGKAIIRTKKYVLQESDFERMETALSELDYIRIKKPLDSAMYNDNSVNVYGKAMLEGYDEITVDNMNNSSFIGKVGFRLSTTVFGVGFPKGTSFEAAKQSLIGKMLIYQLAEPVEIPVEVSGTLVGYPSGTVYLEPFVPDAGVYTDKMEVLHKDLPIKSIEKLSKVDFYTGVETELDVSEAVIAEDKLSFTHPDLSEGDIVFFEYEYDVESTEGETEVEYYDSRYVVKDDVTGKFYKWNVKVSNGTPTIEVVEV